MKILFRKTGKPYTPDQIKKCVRNFSSGYNKTVLRVTEASEDGMDMAVFLEILGIRPTHLTKIAVNLETCLNSLA